MQRPLPRPVALLDSGLRGVGAAVVLEVQLADHRRQLAGVRLQRVEELVAGRHRRARHALQVADPAQRLQHLRRRAAAAVAPAEHQQAAAGAVVVLVVARGAAQLGDLHRGVVRVGRREVREHLRAVDALPGERVVRRRVEAVPGQLLGQEPADAGAAHDLRQLAVVAEHVGVPELVAAAAELPLEEPLPVQELADERLAGRQVAVRLDPRAADRHPAPGLDLAADPPVQVGVARADPVVLLGLRAGEPELRVALHVRRLRAERAHGLAVRLGQRPQPGRVEVRVADRREPVHVRAVAVGEQLAEDLPRRGPSWPGRPPTRRCRPRSGRPAAGRPRTRRARSRRPPPAGGARRSRGAAPTPRGRSGRSGSGRAPPARARRTGGRACRTCRCRPARPAGRAARRRPPPPAPGRRSVRPSGWCSGPGRSARRSTAWPRCG